MAIRYRENLRPVSKRSGERRANEKKNYIKHVARHLDEQMLNEMATIVDKSYGLGVKIVIHSNDHLPEHMHIDDVSTNKTIAKVRIPSKEPLTTNDIDVIDGSLTNKQKKDILEVLRSNDKRLRAPMWEVAIHTWEILHPDD